MGGVPIVEEEWLGLNQQYLLAIKNADFLGIPDFLWRFLLKVSALTKSGYYHRGIRGLLTIIDRLDDANFYSQPHLSQLQNNFLTTCHIHYDLEFWGLYRLIFNYIQKCSIISCHEDIIDVMRERYGVKINQFYQIPTEYSWSQMFEYESHRLLRHYPDYFQRLCEEITVNYPGEVFLVAAGFLGKIYCQIIKSKGGIALDLGSVVDQWLGHDTRSSGKFYNNFKIQYYSQFKKIVNSDSRLSKIPENTDLFVRGKISKSNYYCDKNIYVPTDLFSHWKTTQQKQFLITGHPRCASGFMRYLFQQLGFDVNHEKLGRDGVSSWLMAVKDLNSPWGEKFASYYLRFQYLIFYVRHPQDALPSIVLENDIERSFNFRRSHILRELDFDIDGFGSPLEKAIASFLGWNKIVELRSPDLIVRVEDCVADVVSFMSQHSLGVFPDNIVENIVVDSQINNSLKKYSRLKPLFTVDDYGKIDRDLRVGLFNFCKVYGYDRQFLG